MFGKKIVFFGVICAILALALGACSYKTLVYDDTHPLDKSCTIWFGEGILIKSYNGIPLKKGGILLQDGIVLVGNYSGWTLKNVVLPSGKIEFGLDVYRVVSPVYTNTKTIYKAEDLFFKYKFEPGLNYALTFTAYGGIDEKTWGVRVYKTKPSATHSYKKEDLIAFLPFYK